MALAPEASERPTAAQFRDQLAAVDLGPEATVDRRALALSGAPGGSGPSPVSDPSGRALTGGAAAGSHDAPVDRTPGGAGGDSVGGREELGRETTGERGSRRRDRTLFLAVLLLVVALVAGGIVYFGVTGRESGPIAVPPPGGASTPTTTAPTTSDSPSASSSQSASPSPSPTVPDGFVACDGFGAGTVCPVEPECWAGLQNVGDVPFVATPAECTDTHAYQTYAAVELPDAPRTQSGLESNQLIKALCTKDVLNQRLVSGRAGVLWDIQVVPYRVFPNPDSLSRCVFSTGKERTSPLPLKPV